MFKQKRQPHEVFTPRAPQVNEEMYVPRSDLEGAFERALRGHKHIVIHGESGSGKSWLYKKVLAQQKVPYEVLNLASYNRLGSMNALLVDALGRRGEQRLTGVAEGKDATVNAGVAKADLSHEKTYERTPDDPFMRLVKSLSAKSGSCLVLDNLEQVITDRQALKEITSLIVLADDEAYANHGVKIIVVGVPGDILSLFARVEQTETIANRLVEIPEVARLSPEQTRELLRKGLVDELGVRIAAGDLSEILGRGAFVSDRIPQYVHEYGLVLGNLAVSSRDQLVAAQTNEADSEFLVQAASASKTVIAANMNDRRTKAGRRNQTIYTLGYSDSEEFHYRDVETELRRQFPTSTAGKGLNVGQILSDLSNDPHPLLRSTPKGDAYRFRSPTYRMGIRAMLRRTGDERVERSDGAET